MDEQAEMTFPEACELLVEERDVLGLFELIRTRRSLLQPDLCLSALGRGIRAKAKEDLNGFSDDVFSAILGMGMTMLLRCQLYMERQLAEADKYASDSPPAIPADLDADGWIARAERISRFCAEMATLRARIRHVNGIDDERRDESRRTRRPRLVQDLDEGESQAGGSQESPRSRRKRA